MSAQAIKWARAQRAGGSTEKCVLLNLAACAGEDGICLVPRAELAERSEISRSAVERALVTLGALGLIRRAASAELIEIALMMDGERK